MYSFNDIYKGRTVLVTGHTGFKGSWLSLWLSMLGAKVIGYSLPPSTEPNHYELLKLWERISLFSVFDNIGTERVPVLPGDPEIVFHLAAMAIPVKSFDNPPEVIRSNVLGTANILEACRRCKSVKAVVMITTDKVYESKEWGWGYRENDNLGGDDPYSMSKVCAEHVIRCYRKQFLPQIATARAGNVIGGGDWTYMRLIPDIARATAEGRPVEIYTPRATRPWQHVLEPLSGYLRLGQLLFEGNDVASEWNFGPEGEMTVLEIVEEAKKAWGKVEYVIHEKETHPSMTRLLKLDSTRSKKELGWEPRWNMRMGVWMAMNWYKNYYEKGQINSEEDIDSYTYQVS